MRGSTQCIANQNRPSCVMSGHAVVGVVGKVGVWVPCSGWFLFRARHLDFALNFGDYSGFSSAGFSSSVNLVKPASRRILYQLKSLRMSLS